MIKKIIFFTFIILFLNACNSTKTLIYKETPKKNIISQIEVPVKPNTINKNIVKNQIPNKKTEIEKKVLSNDEIIKKALMQFYNEWKGVRYKFGGNSKKGIDCSAFTQRIFKEKFNIKIPRSTRTQVKVGEKIKKSQLKLGDLVFFKTGRIDRHVGVYMGNGKFMHASIKGVKFTKLNKNFYKKAYWTSRRIIKDL
ncbi:NlpC/P60 family protein [Arcobacter sp. YIC-80]|uniref:NlpC/P60 family protein n=1 Tax=Arcobacter sp. YIC-80 TaxID=3376683 RepID=UPI0038503D25